MPVRRNGKVAMVEVRIGGKRMMIQPITAFYLESLLDIESLTDEWNATPLEDDEDSDTIDEERMVITGEIYAIQKAFKKVMKKPR